MIILQIRTFAICLLLLLLCVAVPLSAQDRARSTVELPRIGTVVELPEHGIFEASMLSVSGNTVYLFDYSRYQLVAYREQEGTFRVIAAGEGGGPEEFRNPTGLDTDREGNVWLADPEQARISVWNGEDKLIKSFNHLRSIPERLAVHGEEVMIRVRNFSADEVFHILDRESRPIAGFGGVNDSLLTSGMVLTGSLHADESGFYYAPRYAGLFYKFDREGGLLYERRTVVPLPVGTVHEYDMDIPGFESPVHVTKPPSPDQTATVDLAVDDRYLYVLFAGNEDGVARIIDVYEKATGDYVKSIGLYEATYDLEVVDGKFYMLYLNDSTREMYLMITEIPDLAGD